MGKVPEGLQQHTLWRMDGCVWVDVVVGESRTRDIAISKGWCRLIPSDKLSEFLVGLDDA